jgi:hypothetical protein
VQNERNFAPVDTGWPDGGVRCEVPSAKSGRSDIRPSDFGLHTSPRQIMQNKAKLEGTGVYGQRQLLSGACRLAGKCAKTNPIWGSGVPRLRIVDCELRIADSKRPAGGGRRRQNAQNKPNLGRPEGPGLRIADWKTAAAGGCRRQNAQNKPNLATRELALNNVVKGSYGRFACDVPLKNKANLSREKSESSIRKSSGRGGEAGRAVVARCTRGMPNALPRAWGPVAGTASGGYAAAGHRLGRTFFYSAVSPQCATCKSPTPARCECRLDPCLPSAAFGRNQRLETTKSTKDTKVRRR